MRSIAQTMAVKTTQIDDRNLKGLMAFQSYIFTGDYQGQVDHPDIYQALYTALAGFNGENYNALKGHEGGGIKSIAFMPSANVFFSSGSDGKILRWDLNGNTKSFRTLINNPINRCMSVSPNGRWLANATLTSSIQLFNLNNLNEEPELLQAHKSWVSVLAFTPDSRGLYSASNDKTIIYWDLINNTQSVFLSLPNSVVRCLVVTDRYIYGGTDDGRLIRWNIETKDETILFRSDKNTISGIAINSSGTRIAFVDKNGSLRLLDVRNNTVTRTVMAHSARIVDVKFSNDDRQIATASFDKTIKIWDATNLGNRPFI